MKTKVLFIALLVSLVFFPGTAVLAQTTHEDEGDFEFDDAGVPTDTSSSALDPVPAQAGGLVCRVGHWISGPRTCLREHIDAVTVLRYCGNIQIGGRWYHIVRVQRFPGRIIITVRRL
jgi:hypothetical protein